MKTGAPDKVAFANLLDSYTLRLVNRSDAYYQQWANDKEYGYRAQYKPVTRSLLISHLRGEVTLSLPAVDSSGYGRWLCFDSDHENGALDQLDTFLRKYRWQTIREARRPSRDGHLWLLFDKPVEANSLMILGSAMIKLAGVSDCGIEVFPKQPKAEKLASGVRAPLGIHTKPGAQNCRSWFEGPDQKVLTQLEWFASQPLNLAEDAIRQAEIYTPIPKTRRIAGSRRFRKDTRFINILELVETRKIGRELVGQCPLCMAEGHDRHRDNLRISLDGTKFCCVFGGPGNVHKSRDIVSILIGAKSYASSRN